MRRHIESNEQREGRGLRQGNEVYGPVFDTSGVLLDPGPGIRIFLYVTERSFDGYVWQAIEAKARGFTAVLRRSVTVRVVDDVDEVVLSAAEAKPWLPATLMYCGAFNCRRRSSSSKRCGPRILIGRSRRGGS